MRNLRLFQPRHLHRASTSAGAGVRSGAQSFRAKRAIGMPTDLHGRLKTRFAQGRSALAADAQFVEAARPRVPEQNFWARCRQALRPSRWRCRPIRAMPDIDTHEAEVHQDAGRGQRLRRARRRNAAGALTPRSSRRLADRHFGVGCDQILLVQKPPRASDADFRYRIFNADGGEVEQCGNGARCFVRFVRDKRTDRQRSEIRVETALRA